MSRRTTVLLVLAAVIGTLRLSGQQSDQRPATAGKVRLLEMDGTIPVLYVPEAEQGALKLQKSMEAAYAWYEKQLRLQNIPVTLNFFDKDMWERFRVSAAYPMPNTQFYPARITIASRGDDEPGARAEGVEFHELGHVFANTLKIGSGNQFVNELIAGIFYLGYIRAERRDLEIAPASAPYTDDKRPRYTTLADLDYLYTGTGAENYYWFQHQLEHIADFLVKDQDFASVIQKLQVAFPADRTKKETIQEIDAHLEGIRAGFLKMAGPLVGPATITRVKPSPCPEASGKAGSSSAFSRFVVQNNTNEPFIVIYPTGTKFIIAPHEASPTLSFSLGASLKLLDGTCLVGRDEPILAVIEKQ